jgi:kinetochore protein NNF1
LEAVQSQNSQLAETIELQRQEIQQLLSSLEAVIGDIEAAVVATNEFNGEGNLRAEAREMDEELRSEQHQ